MILFRSIMNELKISTHSETQPKVSSLLLQNLEEHLVRCGIYEPYDKIYVKHAQELLNADMGRILVALLISQLPRMQLCYTSGMIILFLDEVIFLKGRDIPKLPKKEILSKVIFCFKLNYPLILPGKYVQSDSQRNMMKTKIKYFILNYVEALVQFVKH